MVSILSIDGGGIRGIIPATFLIELEKRTGKPICELFDLIAGTSTGGILATALTLPDEYGKPKHSAEQMCLAYIEHGQTIFQKSPLRSMATLGGLAKPKYTSLGIDSMLEQFLGNKRLHTTLTEILVTAYDLSTSTPWFFKTSYAKNHRSPTDNPLLTNVARATTAVPAFFQPLMMEGHCMVDGGVFAGNPAVCAYAQARNMYPQESNFLVVSLGTGVVVHNRLCSKINNWGIAEWAMPISSVVLNSSSATVDYQMRALVGNDNYIRFQVQLDEDTAKMDNASEKNMKRLVALANEAVSQESEAIDRLCGILKRKSDSVISN